MHRKYNKFLIVSTIFITIFCVYYYFHQNLISEASDSSLSSSLDSSVNKTNSRTEEDTSFIAQLNSLKKIKIDRSIFDNKSFKLLIDNNIKLESVPYGRSNPFSTSDKSYSSSKPEILVKTGQATSITSNSATLSGGIEGVSPNSVYIEYGLTEKLGKVTPKLNPSLVGDFSSNVINLNPKTTYYFRAVANVTGNSFVGEVASFKTN